MEKVMYEALKDLKSINKWETIQEKILLQYKKYLETHKFVLLNVFGHLAKINNMLF